MKPFTDETYDVIERCAAEAAAEGVTMTQHALRWALAQPGVVSALVGVKREEQIDEAAGAGAVTPAPKKMRRAQARKRRV